MTPTIPKFSAGLEAGLRDPTGMNGHVRAELERRRTAFRMIYPETGPLSRAAYHKHMEFFAAGAHHQERALLGGNRCITPWTPIQTGRATRQCVELLGGSFDVRSWDGGSRCTMPASGVFLKALEPAFRIHLDNGEWFDCTRKHQVLTIAGWLSLDQLIRLSSGLRCWGKDEGSKASCGKGGRRCDGQPLSRSGIYRASPPSKDSAPIRDHSCAPADEAEPRYLRSRAFLDFFRSSILDDPNQIVDLCGLFVDPTAELDAQWYSGSRQDLRQFSLEFSRRPEAIERPLGRERYAEPSWPGHEYHDVPGTLAPCPRLDSDHRLFASWSGQGEPVLEFLETAPRTEIFFPSNHPSLCGGNQIVSVVCLGIQPILDFTVENTHCYETAGVVHHNTGKTNCGSFESVCHLTGEYPAWWKGRRFLGPTSGWAAGDTSKTVKEIMQAKLLGTPDNPDSGMLPKELILRKRARTGTPDGIESVLVRHKSGGVSTLIFKSFDQKRISFQGTAQSFIWLDEEVDESIYTECVMRTMKTTGFDGGVVFLTFTPLMGLSDVVQLFIPDGINPSPDRWSTMISWDDVPHLDAKDKAERIKKIPAFQRDARTKGVPQLGSGAIYPIAESDILVEPFPIPKHWLRSYAMDVGGGFAESSTGGTAAIWGAINPDTRQSFLTDEYFRAGAEPSIHAQAIKARGAWMKGVVDPAARGRSQVDGRQLLQMYLDLGLKITPANNAVESGLWGVWDALSTQQLKVFSTCERWRTERNLYRRDEKGNIVKKQDHLQDSCRYWYSSGRDVAMAQPSVVDPGGFHPTVSGGSMGWVR